MSLLLQICVVLVFMVTVGLHIAKKSNGEVLLYALQSLMIVTIMLASAAEGASVMLLFMATAIFVVKVVLAPLYLVQSIRRHDIRMSISTYASLPVTLAGIAGVVLLARTELFAAVANINPTYHTQLVLILAAMLISILLMVNRKGALSQIVGVLSLENCIVAFALLAGLEQSALLQLGILFDIFVWLVIAMMFLGMVHRHTGSLDVTTMKDLRD